MKDNFEQPLGETGVVTFNYPEIGRTFMPVLTADGRPFDWNLAGGINIIRFDGGLSHRPSVFIGNKQNYEEALARLASLESQGLVQRAHERFGDEARPTLECIVLASGTAVFHTGITSYPEFQGLLKTAHTNPLLIKALVEEGRTSFGDPYALVPRLFGIGGLIVTSDGYGIVAPREAEPHEYPGMFDSFAGYVRFAPVSGDTKRTDVEHPKRIDLDWNLQYALATRGIQETDIRTVRCVGAYGFAETGELDFSYVVVVNQDAAFFTRGTWCNMVPKGRTTSRGGNIVALTRDEMGKAAGEGRINNAPILYSTLGAIIAHVKSLHS